MLNRIRKPRLGVTLVGLMAFISLMFGFTTPASAMLPEPVAVQTVVESQECDDTIVGDLSSFSASAVALMTGLEMHRQCIQPVKVVPLKPDEEPESCDAAGSFTVPAQTDDRVIAVKVDGTKVSLPYTETKVGKHFVRYQFAKDAKVVMDYSGYYTVEPKRTDCVGKIVPPCKIFGGEVVTNCTRYHNAAKLVMKNDKRSNVEIKFCWVTRNPDGSKNNKKSGCTSKPLKPGEKRVKELKNIKKNSVVKLWRGKTMLDKATVRAACSPNDVPGGMFGPADGVTDADTAGKASAA